MASTVIPHCSTLSSSLSSPISKKTVENALPFSLSVKKSMSISTSHVVSTYFKKAHKSFIANSNPSGDGTSSEEIPIELKYPAFPTVMDINQIREILPHRFPFLLVDRVIEYSPGVSAVAIKNVTINDNFFPGHFPERPIMPGVLMVEDGKRKWFDPFPNLSLMQGLMPDTFLNNSESCYKQLPGIMELAQGKDTKMFNISSQSKFHLQKLQFLVNSYKMLNVQAMAQVGGLVMLQPEVGGSRDNFFFAGIDKVRFRKPVIAGDTLVMRMNLVKLQKRFGIAKMEGKAYVGGEVVCEGEFLMAMGSE